MRELDLLQHIYAFNAALPAGVTIPPGDDMGAVKVGDANVLITVDQVADGVHFRLEETPLEKIARKAITRNLSDVAAMGAVPVAAVAAGCLPRGFGEVNANALGDHMRAIARRYGCPLIGGDISIWDHPMLLSVTVLAQMLGVEPVLRTGAREGDVICVTGALGGSLVTQPDDTQPRDSRGAREYTHHLDFEPRLGVGRRLASDAELRARCMIDLSDGLAKDLPHLCGLTPLPLREGRGEGQPYRLNEPFKAESDVRRSALTPGLSHPPPGEKGQELTAEIQIERLPLSAAAHLAAQASGKPAWHHAVGDGEDYELCFCVSPQVAAKLPAQIEGVAITQIGVMKPRGEMIIEWIAADGSPERVTDLGWEHHDDPRV
ncbi:MAG: thiamine-phosphate kinase [Phycisphaeraceae bacterium]